MRNYIGIGMTLLLFSCNLYINNSRKNIAKESNTNIAKNIDTCEQYFHFFQKYWIYDSLSNVYYIQDTFLTPREGLYQSFDSLFYNYSMCWKGKNLKQIKSILGKPCNEFKNLQRIEYNYYLNRDFLPQNWKNYNGSYSSKRLIVIETDSTIDRIEMGANKGDIGFLLTNSQYKKKK